MHNTDDGVSNQSLMQDLFWGGGRGADRQRYSVKELRFGEACLTLSLLACFLCFPLDNYGKSKPISD